MVGEWRTCTVEQIKAADDRAIAIGPFGSRMKADTYVAVGVPVIRGNNISDTHALVGDFVFVSVETANELRSCNVFPGDLVFPHRGAIGEVGIVPSGEISRYILSTSLMKLTCNRDLVDPLFVFYFFRSQQGRYALLQNASTVGTPGIGQPLASLRSILVPVPPLPEQRAIAHILGTLDDKIELNRRMNATLAAMAQVLFDHFFPYSTEDKLPDNWRVGRLDEVLVLQRGFDLPTPERFPGPYPVVAASGPSGTHNQFMVRGPGVTTGRSGVLGNVYFVHEDFWPLNTSLWIKEFRNATPAYAYHLLLGLDFAVFNAGSAVPTLNRNHVHNLTVVIPPMKRVQEFDRAVMALLKRQKTNHEESQTLAALRDTLLPKLMSGEVRVVA